MTAMGTPRDGRVFRIGVVDSEEVGEERRSVSAVHTLRLEPAVDQEARGEDLQSFAYPNYHPTLSPIRWRGLRSMKRLWMIGLIYLPTLIIPEG
jgi:hypothetical protein